MNCSTCGRSNADSVSFCEYCGASVRIGSSHDSGAALRSAAVPAVAPSAIEVAHLGRQMGRSFINSLTLGEKFAGAGTIAAGLGFFMPWFSSPDLGSLAPLLGQMGSSTVLTHVSLSGVDLAKFVGAVYLILLAAAGSGVLLYFSRTATAPRKLLMAGFLVLIGSLCGPILVGTLLFVPMIQSVAGAGYWLLSLGYCAVAAGGLITIATVGRTAK